MRLFPILMIFIALFVFGCAGIESQGGTQQMASSSVAIASPSPFAPTDQNIQTQAGYITIEVPQGTLDQKFQDIQGNLKSDGASVTDMTYNEYSDKKEYTITITVPPSKFDDINNMLKQEGEVKELSVTLQDVTKQYMDLDTRINNSQIELERLHDLYNQSTNISDLIQIEQQITSVETELDSLEQQKADLVSHVEMSTIVINVYEPTPPTTQLSLSIEGLGSMFFEAVAIAITVIVAAAGFLIPIAIVLGLIWLVYTRLIPKRKSKPRPPEHSQIPPLQ